MLLTAFILTPQTHAVDFDTDGYHAAPSIGFGPPDCNDYNSSISPKAQEIVGDLADQDCDGSDALRRWFIIDNFHHLDWTTTVPSVNYTGDTIDFTSGSAGYRSLSVTGSTGKVHVALSVAAYTGLCGIALTGSPSFPAFGPPTSQLQFLVGTGVQVLSFPSMPNPPRALTKLEVLCDGGGGSLEIDWISIQNTAEIAFPPSAEISVQWQDVEAPGGGLHTAVVRSASTGLLIGASDAGGVGIKDPLNTANPSWRTINGYGADSIMGPHGLAVWDVAGVDWDSDSAGLTEIYALTGVVYGDDLYGGLWRSDDEGEHWVEVADSLFDGVGYDGRENECGDRHYGGGRLLVPDESTQVLYVASNDEQEWYDFDPPEVPERATGVFLWDDDSINQLCELPTTDLPTDQYISTLALAQADVHPGLSNPVLLVGYKGPGASRDSLYICWLPFDGGSPTESTLDCDSTATVTCTAVSDAQGLDVRDIEVDAVDPSLVYLADGGDDPEDLVGGKCIDNPGQLFAMHITDETLTWYDDIADPAWDTLETGLTGLSMDPDGEFLFAFIPGEGGTLYGGGGAYRIAFVDIGDPYGWEPIDDLDDGPDRGLELSGGWLEAGIVAKPVPRPELWSGGFIIDAIWYEGLDTRAHAVLSTRNNMWDVVGLNDLGTPEYPWDGEDDTFWTFWPEPDLNEPATFQNMSMLDAVVDSHKNLWMATGDHALFMLPYGEPAAERDCLFETFGAGSQDIAIGIDDSIWLSLNDQGAGIPHNSGVFRTLDFGAHWGYQGAGVSLSTMRSPTNQAWCRDQLLDHVAEPLDGEGGGTQFTSDPSERYEFPTTDPRRAAIGNPGSIDALDQNVALLVFSSYTASNGDDPPEPYTITGQVAYTLDGGASWTEVTFDGDAIPGGAVECAQYPFFEAHPKISLVKPGVRTFGTDLNQNGTLDAGEWKIEFVIGARTALPVACTLAHVVVDSSGTTWDWITLDKDSSASYGGCRVDAQNFAGLTASPWSQHAIVWGSYFTIRDTPLREYGGACLVHLYNHTVQAMISPMDSDNQFELDIAEVVPHPQVSNLYMVVTRIGANNVGECKKPFLDSEGDPEADICPAVAWPYLLTGQGSFWNAVPLTDVPPSLVGLGGTWGDIDDATFYYVGGGGTWRGTFAW